MTNWHKSSHSASTGDCVEVAESPGRAYVRDSKLGDRSPILAFDAGQWLAFLSDVRADRFAPGRPGSAA